MPTSQASPVPFGMGLRPDAPDRRDRALYQVVPNIDALPTRADNEHLLPPVMDQGTTGSCTGYSGAAVAYSAMQRSINLGRRDKRARAYVPSPVFMYREARVLGGYVEEDMGAEIRNVWKAASKVGLPPMSNIAPRFASEDLADPQTAIFPEDSIWRRQPAPSHYADGARRQAVTYYKLFVLEDLLRCLAEGRTAQLGFTVFRSMYGWNGPHYNVPDREPGERDLGGHAVVAFGYDKQLQRVFFRNSWGATAHEGRPNFTLSFNYLRLYSGDTWAVDVIEGDRGHG